MLETNVQYSIFQWQAGHRWRIHKGVYHLDAAFPSSTSQSPTTHLSSDLPALAILARVLGGARWVGMADLGGKERRAGKLGRNSKKGTDGPSYNIDAGEGTLSQ